MNLKELSTKMDYKERQGPGGKKLKYITARQAQDRLDDVCGPENWKVEYKEIAGNTFAGVSIKVFNTNVSGTKTGAMYPSYEWITKWDAGSESNIEKEKGHISDSFKRACVCWGIGRFLYGELPGDVEEKEKPWFNEPELTNFVKTKDKYKTYEDAMKVIEKHYRIRTDRKNAVSLLYL